MISPFLPPSLFLYGYRSDFFYSKSSNTFSIDHHGLNSKLDPDGPRFVLQHKKDTMVCQFFLILNGYSESKCMFT